MRLMIYQYYRHSTSRKFTAPTYFISLCGVCFLQNRQYFENSSLSGVVRLFFVVV
jgi:hypothetical protein